MDINLIVKITSRAWSMSILARMYLGVPGRQSLLLSSTGASRTSFTKSLTHLVDLGLLIRNPGHGHPLRPEYQLTLKGAEIGKIAATIVGVAPSDSEFALLRRSWTIPVLAVTRIPRHFTDISSDLIAISDRALSKSLDQLQELEWLRREVDVSSRPLRPLYQAENKGLKICKAINV